MQTIILLNRIAGKLTLKKSNVYASSPKYESKLDPVKCLSIVDIQSGSCKEFLILPEENKTVVRLKSLNLIKDIGL